MRPGPAVTPGRAACWIEAASQNRTLHCGPGAPCSHDGCSVACRRCDRFDLTLPTIAIAMPLMTKPVPAATTAMPAVIRMSAARLAAR